MRKVSVNYVKQGRGGVVGSTLCVWTLAKMDWSPPGCQNLLHTAHLPYHIKCVYQGWFLQFFKCIKQISETSLETLLAIHVNVIIWKNSIFSIDFTKFCVHSKCTQNCSTVYVVRYCTTSNPRGQCSNVLSNGCPFLTTFGTLHNIYFSLQTEHLETQTVHWMVHIAQNFTPHTEH